ncbi:MAG: hypothetical protein M0C28_37680 [Candidatus Moduliflexus flocculans]|nr:hypothetical protein [Candidatus Moduliflexus flocculans]
MKKLTSLVLIACLAAAALSGQPVKTNFTVGHVVYTLQHQYHQAVAKEIVDYGKKMYGAKVIVLDGKADSRRDPQGRGKPDRPEGEGHLRPQPRPGHDPGGDQDWPARRASPSSPPSSGRPRRSPPTSSPWRRPAPS